MNGSKRVNDFKIPEDLKKGFHELDHLTGNGWHVNIFESWIQKGAADIMLKILGEYYDYMVKGKNSR